MPYFGIESLQEIPSYLWINGTLTFKRPYRIFLLLKYGKKLVMLPKLWTFGKKVEVSDHVSNHYINKILDIHPLTVHNIRI